MGSILYCWSILAIFKGQGDTFNISVVLGSNIDPGIICNIALHVRIF